MFFWGELCKLPPEHWYFGWHFESNKLFSSNGTLWQNLLRFSKNFQVLLQYFEDRSASFLRGGATEQLLRSSSREKSCAIFWRRFRPANRNMAYKDISFQTFINVDGNYSLHVSEAFRNASPSGSDIYRRVYLKVRESDSPFFIEKTFWFERGKRESMYTKQPKSLFSSFASSVNSERSVVADVCDWKTSNANHLSQKLQSQDVQ